jgi:hypothetical protein
MVVCPSVAAIHHQTVKSISLKFCYYLQVHVGCADRHCSDTFCRQFPSNTDFASETRCRVNSSETSGSDTP